MIWFFVIAILGYIMYRFFSALNKDNYDLQNRTLDDKFSVIVDAINEAAFNGRGTVTNLDKRAFNLYEVGKNQIIHFNYGTGHLTITWKYKFFQKEVVHEKQFNDVRNLSIFEQQKIANQMIAEMARVVESHQMNTMSGIY
ncbi:hypothetical protein [Pontibacter ramchanderi]|uniref:Uncharacterized protein n=1 Tax=Pontibacter ramchanderi TaxID=1179743 RepID=A0A2N3V2M5_9BACT|nr:hypothetical protein [Pontibacter ramchanderi]PKV75885.1 hypothetical protein BD749_0833 [Pontibacter ramchanderi]